MAARKSEQGKLYICLTTLNSKPVADRMAESAIASQLAACVQIDPPTESVYLWKGQIDRDIEHRVWFKVLGANREALKEAIFKLHPYDTPQWIEIEANNADEKYLKWAREVSNFHGF